MTTEAPPEATDRQMPEIGGYPTARNAGLYDQYAPLQRFQMYLTNYVATATYAAFNGTTFDGYDYDFADREDETAILLGAIALDQEALDAAWEYAANSDMPVEARRGMIDWIDAVYGEGDFTMPVDNEYGLAVNALHMPQVNMNDREAYGNRVDEMLLDVGQGYGNRDFYATQGVTVSAFMKLVDGVGETIGAYDTDPNYGDLFHYSYAQSEGPQASEMWESIRNMGREHLIPGATDLLIGAALAPFAMAGVSKVADKLPFGARYTQSGADFLQPTTKYGVMAGEPAVGSAINTMGTTSNTLGRIGGNIWRARQTIAPAYIGAAGAGMVISASQANQEPTSFTTGGFMGLLDEEARTRTADMQKAAQQKRWDEMRMQPKRPVDPGVGLAGSKYMGVDS